MWHSLEFLRNMFDWKLNYIISINLTEILKIRDKVFFIIIINWLKKTLTLVYLKCKDMFGIL